MKTQSRILFVFSFFLFFSLITQHSSLNTLFAQAPQKFNYQAVARNGNAVLENTTMDVKFEILQDNPDGIVVWTETHMNVLTNSYGLLTIQVGSISEIAVDWEEGPYFLKVQLDIGSGMQEFGNAELLSVPYALNTQSVSSLEKLDIRGSFEMNPDSALFEVKRSDGQTVFAVYNQGVRVYVEEGSAKGSKGGFAIGGFNPGKGETGEYFRVTTDSVRIYLDNSSTKGSKGGFAIGGFNPGKGMEQEYLRVTEDSTRIYIDNTSAKGSKGGFAIGGFNPGKGTSVDFMNMSPGNYFIGHESGKSISTGLYNSFLGYQSGLSTTGGSNNALFGYQAGYHNNTGSGNLFLGYQTGFSNMAGNYNSFLGYLAGYSNTTGAHNTFLGSFSGYTNVEGSNNTFVGDSTGFFNLSGIENTFLGTGCGKNNTSGTSNVFIGNKSGFGNKSGESNVYIGDRSGYSNSWGDYNVYIGHQAGFSSNGDNSNVFIGYQSGYSSTVSYSNVFIGEMAGKQTTWGYQNVYIGDQAGEKNTTGSYNVCIGVAAGGKSSSSDNVFLGFASGWDNTTGAANVFLGNQSGWSNTTGGNNIFIGNMTGYSNETGTGNIFIGKQAGWSELGSDKLYIENTTADAANALIWGDFDLNRLRFNANVGAGGYPAYSMYGLVVRGGTTNSLRVYSQTGQTGQALYVGGDIYATGLISSPSDKRFKRNVHDLDGALGMVLSLQGVTYEWESPDEIQSLSKKFTDQEEDGQAFNLPEGKQIGLIAQDVEGIVPEIVCTDGEGFMSIDYSKLGPILLEAIKEQQKIIESQEQRIVALENEKDELAAMKKQIAELQKLLGLSSQQ